MSSASLSYADRAKKAQSIRSPIENTVHAVSVSMLELTSVSSPFSSNISSTSSSSSNAGSSTVISSNSTDVDAADITAPTTSNSSVFVESDGECNGDQQEQMNQQKEQKMNETEDSWIISRKPSVNVWQKRMAEAKVPQSKRDFVLSSSTPKPSSSKPSAINSVHTKKPGDEPFITKVRPTSNSLSSRPGGVNKPETSMSLDLRDSIAWPEVGVGLHSPSKDKGKGKLSNEEESVVKENDDTTSSSSKSMKAKSKSKWVAIPAEELRAAADAVLNTRRKQAKIQSNPITTFTGNAATDSPSNSRSRNQSQSRDTSCPRQSMPQISGSSGKMARSTGTFGSKSVPCNGTVSGPHSGIQSRTGSVHGSPVALREVGLPQETEGSKYTGQTPFSLPLGSKAEATHPISTYVVPTSTSSPLPSVFPVQIQQQHQQAKFNASQNYSSGTVSPHELPAGGQSAYFNEYHATLNSTPSSLSLQSPPMEQNLPQPPLLQSSHSSNVLPSSSTPYTSPYPFYTSYEYTSFPGMTHSNPQTYLSGSSPIGNDPMTPNYNSQTHSSIEYGYRRSIREPSTLNPTYPLESHHNRFAHAPMLAPVSPEAIEPILPRVVFGSFDERDMELNSGNLTTITSQSSFCIGLGLGEARSSKYKKVGMNGRKKREESQPTVGVMMLNTDAEIVDLTKGLTSLSTAGNRTESSSRWNFGRFGDSIKSVIEDEGVEQNIHSQQSNGHLHLVTPPHPSLPPAYIPVNALSIPVPVPAPVPPMPLSTLASLPPIHTHFPHPIPPHPNLTQLGPFSAETGISTSPTFLVNGSGDVRGGLSPEDGGSKHGADNLDEESNGNEWVVRDFGYGFGRESKGNHARDKAGFAVDQYFTGPSHAYHGNGIGRPRRGSYNTYAGHGERGAYSPRRSGRGYGRGHRGFRRGTVHGSYGYDIDRERDSFAFSLRDSRPGGHVSPSSQHHQGSFTLTPPPHFQPLPLPPVDHGLHTYIPLPTGYDSYFQPTSSSLLSDTHGFRAPMPAPISRFSVALDPTVYSLLGQLEYYLSPQNLAQDFFLRKKMDSHGWVPIPLIASFNRVRQITTDEALVRDVLSMSSVVEVQGDMVRMKEGEWERFVLPGAQTSRVDSIHDFSLTPSSGSKVRSFVEEAVMRHIRSDSTDAVLEGEAETEEETEVEEEEEEEDVVFVMG